MFELDYTKLREWIRMGIIVIVMITYLVAAIRLIAKGEILFLFTDDIKRPWEKEERKAAKRAAKQAKKEAKQEAKRLRKLQRKNATSDFAYPRGW